MLVGNLKVSSLLKSVMISTIKAGCKGCKCIKIKTITKIHVIYMLHWYNSYWNNYTINKFLTSATTYSLIIETLCIHLSWVLDVSCCFILGRTKFLYIIRDIRSWVSSVLLSVRSHLCGRRIYKVYWLYLHIVPNTVQTQVLVAC